MTEKDRINQEFDHVYTRLEEAHKRIKELEAEIDRLKSNQPVDYGTVEIMRQQIARAALEGK